MDNLLRQHDAWPDPDGDRGEVASFPSLESSRKPRYELEPIRICSICSNIVPFAYFRMRGQIACESCALRATIGRPAMSDAAFVSALFFGVCGAMFSLILCAACSMLTHASSLYFVWFIGWLVGKAMKQGSNGLGGLRFQLFAVTLTYAGISLAGALAELIQIFSSSPVLPQNGLASALQSAILSPVRLDGDPVIAGIRLIVLAVGLCIAWRLTAPESIRVDGPYGVPAE